MQSATIATPRTYSGRSLPPTSLSTVICRTLPVSALLAAALSCQTLSAQQPWQQNPQVPDSRYVQPNPNYVPYSQAQQPAYSQQPPYESRQDPGQAYAGPPDADTDQYAPTQPTFGAQQSAGQPFAAEQLEQLVAPIALYPDNLVAQILAASTYPAQVAAADNWLRAQGNVPLEQIAYGARAQTSWDPSIKALTAFPQVLDMMDRDLRWTTDLGNAYYSQPQDVMQTIQVMRQRAQSAGNLQNTPQEQVSYDQGYIQLAPPNPQVVYVPTYNPWTAYGQPVSPYPGFSFGDALGAVGSFLGTGLRFGSGIGLAAFNNTPFGWAGWLLNWLGSSIFFHQSPYYSHSTSVAHWGGGRDGYGHGGINRRPAGFDHPQQAYNGFGNGYNGQGFRRPVEGSRGNYAYNRGAEFSNRAYGQSYVRPALRNDAYNRPQIPARTQEYARSGGYGPSFYSAPRQSYAVRPEAPYSGSHIAREPAMSAYQRNEFAQRSYAEPRSYAAGRGSVQAFRGSEQHSGGFHMFGGGHGGGSYHSSFHAPKAPKMSGGGHHSGGGHSSHHGR